MQTSNTPNAKRKPAHLQSSDTDSKERQQQQHQQSQTTASGHLDPTEQSQQQYLSSASAVLPKQTTEPITIASHTQNASIMQAASELQALQTLESRSSKKRRKRRLKIAVGSALLVVLIVVAWLVIPPLLMPQQKDIALTTDIVTRGTFINSINGTGSLAAAEQVTITSEVMGTVSDVKVSEGDTVEKGQLLFVIDNSELDRQIEATQRSLDSANLNVRATIQARDDASRQAGSAWQSYTDAKNQVDAERAKATAAGQPFDEIMAKKEIESAYQAALSADSAVVNAQQQIDTAYLQVADAQSSLDQAKAQLEKRNIYSPISGQVITQNLERGMDLKTLSDSGKFPMQIADRSKMSVTLSINETDILKLAVGQEAVITFEALPEYSAIATVKRIAPTAEGAGSSPSALGAAATGTVVAYPVELLIDDPDTRLKIGMTASAEISLQQLDNVLIVNSLAVQILGLDTVIYVQDDAGNIEPKAIDVVEDNGNIAVVEGDVKDGDIVVLNNMGSAGDSDFGGMSGGSATMVLRAG